MMKFAANFVVAFVGFFALACAIVGIAIGPIFVLISFGIHPYPYGMPIALAIYCALAALMWAIADVKP